jgi:hypothetical protein
MKPNARDCIGTQIWIERNDSAERIDILFAKAAATGHGWVRIFLMWPWVEASPGEWDFRIYDAAFDAGARHGLKLKATLTCNSGPWHIGTPAMLHSHTGFLSPDQREPMREYIRRCVQRYHQHPALAQWILWNEPNDLADPTPERLKFWQDWLRKAFQGKLDALNHEWLTGYTNFEEIPFASEIPHPLHRGRAWNPYGPILADYQARREWLLDELGWIKAEVRRIDPTTELCVNPDGVFINHAQGGYHFTKLAGLVDVLGASFHPAWRFLYAQRGQYPALIAAGVRYLDSAHDQKAVEVTEVQSGNTVHSGNRPNAVLPDELARFYLAGLAGGAKSVIGWCFNQRSSQNEAGDWALLDNLDEPSPRSDMIKRLHHVLETTFEKTGPWTSEPNRALVVGHPTSHAIEAVEARFGGQLDGRRLHDGSQAQSLLTVALMQCGIPASPAYFDRIASNVVPQGLLVASHFVAWEKEDGHRLLQFAEAGGTVLLDAASGRRDPAARMHQPWPGGMAQDIGLRAQDLETNSEGFPIEWHGQQCGKLILARLHSVFEKSDVWSAWDQPRFKNDGSPVVWERRFGKGRILFFRGYLGASLTYDPTILPAVFGILRRAGEQLCGEIRPVSSGHSVIALPVRVKHGALTVVLADNQLERNGRPIHLKASHGLYHEFWSGQDLTTGPYGELSLAAENGIALLWRKDP